MHDQPLEQSASLAHFARHWLVAESQRNGVQITSAPRKHAPLPSQTEPPMRLSPEHFAGAPHVVPGATGQHFPTVPGSAQLTQSPVQAELQQTPLRQKPPTHSLSCLQATPKSRLRPHEPLTQVRPAAQSASLVHVSWHWPVA
jgi:hypothetical protein